MIKSLRESAANKSSETKRVVVEATASFEVREDLTRAHDKILSAIETGGASVLWSALDEKQLVGKGSMAEW